VINWDVVMDLKVHGLPHMQHTPTQILIGSFPEAFL
jgi:hypothetical protein